MATTLPQCSRGVEQQAMTMSPEANKECFLKSNNQLVVTEVATVWRSA
jgi:hypothetical protein